MKLSERYTSESDLYTTREELKQAEEQGEGKIIRWDKWDALVEKTKEDLKDIKNCNKRKKGRKNIQKYVYNLALQLIKKFDSSKAVADYYGLSQEAVNVYALRQKPFYKLGLYISNTEITEEEKIILKALIRKKFSKK